MKFPILAKYIGPGSNRDEFIVLFTGYSVGIVVYAKHGCCHNIGTDRTDWFECSSERYWKLLDGLEDIVCLLS